jgi:hypothetical protein
MPHCRKYIFQNFKKFEKFSWWTSRHYMYTHKVLQEFIFCGLCKKDNYQAARTVFSPKKFVGEHRMFIWKPRFFCLNFLTFQNHFFIIVAFWWYEPKHYVRTLLFFSNYIDVGCETLILFYNRCILVLWAKIPCPNSIFFIKLCETWGVRR